MNGYPDDIKSCRDCKCERCVIYQWYVAVQAFIDSPEGCDWVGSDEKRDQMGRTLEVLGLIDPPDKTDALIKAWAYMKSGPRVAGNNTSMIHKIQKCRYCGHPVEIAVYQALNHKPDDGWKPVCNSCAWHRFKRYIKRTGLIVAYLILVLPAKAATKFSDWFNTWDIQTFGW